MSDPAAYTAVQADTKICVAVGGQLSFLVMSGEFPMYSNHEQTTTPPT